MSNETYKSHRGEAPKNKKLTIFRLLSYLKNYKLRLILVVLSIVVSSICLAFGSYYIGQVIVGKDISNLQNGIASDFSQLNKDIVFLAIVFLIGVLTSFFYNRSMVIIAQGVLKQIRDDMFEKMQTLPIKYFDTNSYGDIMSKYTNDTDTLEQMISMNLHQMISSIMTILTVLIFMFLTNLLMTAFVLLCVVLMLYITRILTKKSSIYFMQMQKAIGQTTGFIEEMINGQKVIKVFNHEEKTIENFDKLNNAMCEYATKAHSYANTLFPILANIGNLEYILVAMFGGIVAIINPTLISAGVVVSFLMYTKTFNRPVAQISNQVNSVIMALAGAERIFALLDEKPEVDEGHITLVNVKVDENNQLVETKEQTLLWAWKDEKNNSLTQLKGDVRFNNVNFGYNENKEILHNISLYAKPGQKIAFVGATGAGKTTITNLINRFYDISEGSITYDGIDVKQIKKSALRQSLGIVLQDTNLFTGTVKENIRYGKLNATDEEIVNAAILANAHDFISKLPNGYDTQLKAGGEGLSQGQRQLLSIARCAVANPPVMILDEATSSIDTRTEAIVQKGMDALMQNRTVFVIAHRLSTVRNSNAIMVLENGVIIERGDHEDLLNQKGKYYALYTGAFELE